MNLNMKSLIVAAVAATPIFFGSAGASAEEQLLDIQKLGKALFFDEISIPGNKQGCVSCHSPEKGWILPDSAINAGQVVANGAAPHSIGKIKPPQSAYSTFSPPLKNNGQAAVGFDGGVFWNGRATGAGVNDVEFVCTNLDDLNFGPNGFTCVPDVASRTVKPSDIPANITGPTRDTYISFLGPTTDQALNPFTPGGNEQNIREKNVCQRVKTASYKALYKAAYGVDIDCSPEPQLKEGERAYNKSFKLLALAIGAWQHSDEVNQFSSRVDNEIKNNPNFERNPDGSGKGGFLTKQEMDGHDLFYSTIITPPDKLFRRNGQPIFANCTLCHNSGQPFIVTTVPPLHQYQSLLKLTLKSCTPTLGITISVSLGILNSQGG